MKIKYFIGIDVSKATLDVSLVKDGKQLFYKRIDNSKKAIKQLVSTLKKQFFCDVTSSVYCMEHTGIYNNHLLAVLHEKSINIWLESAMQIKRSMGVQRGKNDKIDAQRIALRL